MAPARQVKEHIIPPRVEYQKRNICKTEHTGTVGDVRRQLIPCRRVPPIGNNDAIPNSRENGIDGDDAENEERLPAGGNCEHVEDL